jgi:hypothetical protein
MGQSPVWAAITAMATLSTGEESSLENQPQLQHPARRYDPSRARVPHTPAHLADARGLPASYLYPHRAEQPFSPRTEDFHT